MSDHRVEELVPFCRSESELAILGLIHPHHVAGIVDPQQDHDAFELFSRRRLLQVVQVLGLESSLLEQAAHSSTLGAIRVEENLYIRHSAERNLST